MAVLSWFELNVDDDRERLYMIELLGRFGGKFRRYMVIGPACKLIEVIFDLLTPLVIAQMIDKGYWRTM